MNTQRSTGSVDAAHTPTPWRVFTNDDGTKLVGIGSGEGQGILDCGFGVWAWDDAEGIANAELVVKAVNSHPALVKALENARSFIDPDQPPCRISNREMVSEINAALANI